MSGWWPETIRGGQTTLHNLRMAGQMGRFLFFGVPLVFAIVFVPTFAARLDWGRVDAAWLYFRARHFNIGIGEDGVYEYKYGNETRHYDANTVINSEYFSGAWAYLLETGMAAVFWGVVAAGFFAVCAMIWFRWHGRGLSGAKHIRGGQRTSGKLLDRLAAQTYRKRSKDAPVYELAGVRYPAGGETLHTLIVGSTGTGKTVAMSGLLDQIRARSGKAIVYDMLGSYVPAFYDPAKDHILNPFDMRSAGWTVFSDVTKPHDCDTIATALMPQFKDTADPFWVNGARGLFSGAAKTLLAEIQDLKAAGGPHDKTADLRARMGNKTLLELAVRTDLKVLAQRLENTVAQAIIDPQNPKTSLSVRTVLTTYLSSLEHLPVPERLFSIREWVAEADDSFLFLSSSSDIHTSMQSLIATWLEIATVSILGLEQNPDRRIWIIIDELPTLTQIPSLTTLLRLGRQFGACVVLGTQAISELRHIYDRNGAETISANCNSRLALHTPDMPTAEWLADNFGRQETSRRNESVSLGASEIRDGRSYTERNEVKQLVLPTEIMGLRPLGGFLKMAQLDAVAEVTLKPRNREACEKAFIPRPPETSETPSGQPPGGGPPGPHPGETPHGDAPPAPAGANGDAGAVLDGPAPAPLPSSLPPHPAVDSMPDDGSGEPPDWMDAPEQAAANRKKPATDSMPEAGPGEPPSWLDALEKVAANRKRRGANQRNLPLGGPVEGRPTPPKPETEEPPEAAKPSLPVQTKVAAPQPAPEADAQPSAQPAKAETAGEKKNTAQTTKPQKTSAFEWIGKRGNSFGGRHPPPLKKKNPARTTEPQKTSAWEWTGKRGGRFGGGHPPPPNKKDD